MIAVIHRIFQGEIHKKLLNSFKILRKDVLANIRCYCTLPPGEKPRVRRLFRRKAIFNKPPLIQKELGNTPDNTPTKSVDKVKVDLLKEKIVVRSKHITGVNITKKKKSSFVKNINRIKRLIENRNIRRIKIKREKDKNLLRKQKDKHIDKDYSKAKAEKMAKVASETYYAGVPKFIREYEATRSGWSEDKVNMYPFLPSTKKPYYKENSQREFDPRLFRTKANFNRTKAWAKKTIARLNLIKPEHQVEVLFEDFVTEYNRSGYDMKTHYQSVPLRVDQMFYTKPFDLVGNRTYSLHTTIKDALKSNVLLKMWFKEKGSPRMIQSLLEYIRFKKLPWYESQLPLYATFYRCLYTAIHVQFVDHCLKRHNLKTNHNYTVYICYKFLRPSSKERFNYITFHEESKKQPPSSEKLEEKYLEKIMNSEPFS